jgi:hypothetical protein
VHDVGLPIGHHCVRKGINDDEPEGVQNILENFAESITISNDLPNHDHALEPEHQEALSSA